MLWSGKGRYKFMPRSGLIGLQDSPRLLLPLAVAAALRALIADEPMDPSARRAELRSLLYRLQRVYRLPAEVNEVELAQQLAEEDGIPIEDAP